jgi:hypothetical protein
MKWWFLQKSGRNHRKNNDIKHNKKLQTGAMWHKTQRTENLFGGRKYLPDPALPANAPASENKRSADDFGGRKNWQRLMDGGWLTAIDRFYCRNSVGLISAKYCSDAKWYTRHGGVIFSPSHSFAEKGKMLPLTYDDDLSGWSFFCQNHGLPFFVYYG